MEVNRIVLLIKEDAEVALERFLAPVALHSAVCGGGDVEPGDVFAERGYNFGYLSAQTFGERVIYSATGAVEIKVHRDYRYSVRDTFVDGRGFGYRFYRAVNCRMVRDY